MLTNSNDPDRVRLGEKIILADSIPTLGHGGKSIKDKLIDAASFVQPGQFILDAGPFLGSTTSYLLIGSHPEVSVVSLDRWNVDDDLVMKGREHVKPPLNLEKGRDLLPLWKFYTSAFGRATPIQKDSKELKSWPYGKIALFVNDMNSSYETQKHIMEVLEPHFTANAQMILMDYYLYETHENRDGLKIWYEEISQKNPGLWTMQLQRTRQAAFLFRNQNQPKEVTE